MKEEKNSQKLFVFNTNPKNKPLSILLRGTWSNPVAGHSFTLLEKNISTAAAVVLLLVPCHV